MTLCLAGYIGGVQQSIPLTGVNIKGTIIDYCTEISLEQRFENVSDSPVEAYTLPLDDTACVCKFYAYIDGERVEGIIEEKETAANEYDDSIAKGNTALLLEQEKDNTFRASLGNIPPHKEIVVVVTYISELQISYNQVQLIVPVPKAVQERSLPENQQAIPEGVNIDITIETTSDINGVTSPTHPVEFVKFSSTSASITLHEFISSSEESKFVLLIELADPHKPIYSIQDNVGMLALNVDMSGERDPIIEVIFFIDRSGSMQGEKIKKVRDTMLIFLHSLPLYTQFNIVGFGSTYDRLFPESLEYNDRSLAKATEYVEKMGADLGGTVLDQPMRDIFASPVKKGVPRQVFILTDGAVDNSDDCINIVRSHARSTRVFTFGICGASPALVLGLAKAGNGKAELILGNENLESKVISQLQSALQPGITDITVKWGEFSVEQTPKNIPVLYSGSRIIAYAYLPPNINTGDLKLEYTCHKRTGTYSLNEVRAKEIASEGENSLICKLAARSLLRDIENETIGSDTYAQQKERAVQLSTKYGILCKYTAFLIIKNGNQAIYNSMVKIDKKDAFGRNFTGSSKYVTIDGQQYLVRQASFSKTGKHGSAKVHMIVEDADGKKRDIIVPNTMYSQSTTSTTSASATTSSAAKALPENPTLKHIIYTQRASGNFVANVLEIVKVTMADLKAVVPSDIQIPSSIKSLDELLISCLKICEILKQRYLVFKEQWVLVENKAQTWIRVNTSEFGTNWKVIAAKIAQYVKSH